MTQEKTKASSANKRSIAQREADLAWFAKLMVSGHSRFSIARLLAADESRPYTLSPAMIQKDMDKVRAEWRANKEDYVQAGVEKVMAELDDVTRMAQEGFARSLLNLTKKTAKERKAHAAAAKGQAAAELGKVNESKVQVDEQTGDPAFLRVILDASEKRARILGVAAPQKVELTGEGLAAAVAGLPAPDVHVHFHGDGKQWGTPIPG